MYLKGLWNWPIFMLIKVQEMEVSCLKYITAPRKTYCVIPYIFKSLHSNPRSISVQCLINPHAELALFAHWLSLWHVMVLAAASIPGD